MEDSIKFAHQKIWELAYLHGVYVKETTGKEINLQGLQYMLLREHERGFYTISEIKEDIAEYLRMRKKV